MDDSTQKIAGRDAMALGVVGVPVDSYNQFCRAVYRIKQEELGAQELTHKELKGNHNFAKAQFVRVEASGTSPLLTAVDRMLNALEDANGVALAVASFDTSTLKTGDDLMFPPAYREATWRMLKYAKAASQAGEWDGLSAIMLDQVGHREDQRAGAAFQNYFTRHQLRYQLGKYFLQVPHFTHSSLSPGLQAADLLAYLACQQLDPSNRPELQRYWDRFMSMHFYYYDSTGARRHSCGPLSAEQPIFDLGLVSPSEATEAEQEK